MPQSTLDGWYRKPASSEHSSNRGSHRGGNRGGTRGGNRDTSRGGGRGGGESPRGGSYRGGRGSSRGFHSSGRQMSAAQLERRRILKAVADETKDVLPTILSDIPAFNAASSSIHDLKNLPPLDPNDCPGFTLSRADPHAGAKGTRIRVLNQDSFDAALDLTPNLTAGTYLSAKPWLSNFRSATKDADNDTQMTNADDLPSQSTQRSTGNGNKSRPSKPAAVLNLASEKHPGGGFHNGALAQEEALCYRSSLYLSLHKSYYPLPSLSAIYTPAVLIIRNAMSSGHILQYPTERALDLPVASVITLAALRHPEVTPDWRYKNAGAREETKRKIRVILRVAAHGGHTKIVLGALGCGVFGNPRGEVARCFLEVFREAEFSGGWWEDVVFAVLDSESGLGSNIGVFTRELEGQVV